MHRSLFFVLLLSGTLCLTLTLTGSTARADHVEYTWTLAALGQGGWIGGPLFEDGTAGGGGAFSAGNGNVVANFNPTTWTENASGQITVCFDVVVHKGSFAPSLCIGPADVTGTPVKVQLFGSEHIFRITEH